MRDQAREIWRRDHPGRVTRLDPADGGFGAEWGEGAATARTVLVATGVRNRRPTMDEELHDEALARGLIRYCPICDGYEVTDRKIGVIGSGAHGVAEAVFLRGYTADVTLIAPDRAHEHRPRRSATASARTAFASSTGPARGVALDEAASSSTPPRAIIRSTASIRRSARTCTASWPSRSASRSTTRRAASSSTRTSAPSVGRLCRRRRRHRPRPDQPRHGRGRRRGDDDPQRPRETAADQALTDVDLSVR